MSEPIRVLVIEQLVRWHIPFCAVLEMDQPIILVLLDINPRMGVLDFPSLSERCHCNRQRGLLQRPEHDCPCGFTSRREGIERKGLLKSKCENPQSSRCGLGELCPEIS